MSFLEGYITTRPTSKYKEVLRRVFMGNIYLMKQALST
jgi:hypothetical protein